MAMSRLQNLYRNSVVLVLLVVPAIPCIHAQQVDNISKAKGVVLALYPELKGRNLHDIIADGSGMDNTVGGLHEFTLNIFQPVNYAGPDTCPSYLTEPRDMSKQFTDRCPAFILSVKFVFPPKGDPRIHLIGATGEGTNETLLAEARKQVNSHPHWTEAEVENALKKAGAHFGPKDKSTFLQSVPVQTLETLLSKITILKADFLVRDQEGSENSTADLTWDVLLLSHVEGRKDLRYRAAFEPFNGRLVYLAKNPLVQ
jgi:hypothetical protein